MTFLITDTRVHTEASDLYTAPSVGNNVTILRIRLFIKNVPRESIYKLQLIYFYFYLSTHYN